jgi:spore maturation protein CgeB
MLLVEPARQRRDFRFVVAGSQYPDQVSFPQNIARIEHLAPSQHRAFYTAQRFTLNLTRADMRRVGYAPSVRLFEAAACATPIISDWWEGLDTLFTPGEDILIASSANDTLRYLEMIGDDERRRIGERGRERVREKHTAGHRAEELELILREAQSLRSPM